MSPTPLTALLIAACAVLALVLPPLIPLALAVALLTAACVDALAVRGRPRVIRRIADVLSRGVPARLSITLEPAARARVRQATPPDFELGLGEGDGGLETVAVAHRRGRHVLPSPAVRRLGPLHLGTWTAPHDEDEAEVHVYPDLPAARRVAVAARYSRFRDPSSAGRGALGLGTEFESIRDYEPDDDIRQLNWKATARLGAPMSNDYRLEQDRDLICMIDSGRLMGAPIGEVTRLDSALDAVTALAAVADEMRDRFGAIAFDDRIRVNLPPRRGGGAVAVRRMYDLEPSAAQSDYRAAFQAIEGAKRAFVLVFTDLLEESAARPLVETMPVLARRHAVAVVSVTDADLERVITEPPRDLSDALRSTVTVEVLDARRRVAALLRATGATVVEARADRLGAACVREYLRAKARARL